MREPTRPTATSAFGVGRRESHDSTGFYARFEVPELTDDETVTALPDLPQGPAACVHGDSAAMVLPTGGALPANSVALVVTSPPYFVGKEYEQALGEGHVPASYVDYLEMLRSVFSECKRVLEPGGRLAVNVANLGRKPYRSLSADVIRILQDDLRLLLRGEVVWRKAEGAGGSCAWGSFRSPANPVLRDVTERVVIASKGRFDRALNVDQRRRAGLPHVSSVSPDEFMAATLDVWELPPESARRVGHPAPFPVELPERLITLYTYRDDLVVDPFMGSGTTLVAAARTGRRYLGFDLDPAYVDTARARVTLDRTAPRPTPAKVVPALAEDVLEAAGFTIRRRAAKLRGLGVTVSVIATDAEDRPWYFDVTGAYVTGPGGLARTDNVWKLLGRAHVLARHGHGPIVVLTSHLPRPGSEGWSALRSVGPEVIFDAVELLDEAQTRRLRSYARGDRQARAGFWTETDLRGR